MNFNVVRVVVEPSNFQELVYDWASRLRHIFVVCNIEWNLMVDNFFAFDYIDPYYV